MASETRTQTLRGRYATEILRKHVKEQLARRVPPKSGFEDAPDEPQLPKLSDFHGIPPPSTEDVAESSVGKVCIVGAGAAGIYMAWMLTYLGIDYDLFEATDRIGGRIYTYNGFGGDKSAHNYYDVGAMRIPLIDSNKPTNDVIDYLKIDAPPYYLDNTTAPYYFNRAHITSTAAAQALDPLQTAIQPFLDDLKRDFATGFQKLLKTGGDEKSTRQWLKDAGIKFDESQVLETFDTGTGLFDQSFTETVLDFADFPANACWRRIEGGMIGIINAIANKIKTPATLNTTVKELKMNNHRKVEVTYSQGGKRQTQTYHAVFNSTTLGALGRMELNNLGSPTQLTAIRSLAYDQATKVAIKFKTAWWVTKGKMDKHGGISGTDLPIRVVAYPPWTDEDDPKQPTVIIASYTWHQDAVRVGSLNPNSKKPPVDSKEKSEVIDLVLRNLVTVFNNPDITYDFLLDQVQDYHTYSWHNDSVASGAFALFGPGQFTHLYPSLFSPLANSDGNVYIIGEHASAHHAWIAGAFASAATSLFTWLLGLGLPGMIKAGKLKFSYALGGPPFGHAIMPKGEKGPLKNVGLPDEMEEDVVYAMAQLAKEHPPDKKYRF